MISVPLSKKRYECIVYETRYTRENTRLLEVSTRSYIVTHPSLLSLYEKLGQIYLKNNPSAAKEGSGVVVSFGDMREIALIYEEPICIDEVMQSQSYLYPQEEV